MKSDKDTKHILLLGDGQYEAIEYFLKECFHEDHGDMDTDVVIMRSTQPSEEFKQILKNSAFDSRVHYLQGSPLNHTDLQRCQAETAQCTIIMSNQFCKSHQSEDYKNILNAFAIKKYVKQMSKFAPGGNPEMRVCLQIAKPEHKDLYYSGLSQTQKVD